MNADKNILIAFLLNLFFSILEFIGGFFTNSISIISDSIHDLGDSISIGISYFLEKKSYNKPDNIYSYGYRRYSVLGGVITTSILIVGSIIVVYNAIVRILSPIDINYKGMLVISVFGILFNFLAAFYTKDGKSINQKSVNLHMLEDVLGWIVVFIGSIIMNIVNVSYIDSFLSILVSLFILFHALKNLKEALDLFLIKTPNSIDFNDLKDALKKVKGVDDIHHIHIWSMDGVNNYLSMHVVTKNKNTKKIKDDIRVILRQFNICHSILETEDEICDDVLCNPSFTKK